MNEYKEYVRSVNEATADALPVTADDLARLDAQDRAAEWQRRRNPTVLLADLDALEAQGRP
jgi:class 3 adenylate cyclase